MLHDHVNHMQLDGSSLTIYWRYESRASNRALTRRTLRWLKGIGIEVGAGDITHDMFSTSSTVLGLNKEDIAILRLSI